MLMIQMCKRAACIDEDVDKILRDMQAKIIRETNSSHSFSSVVNDVLRKGLK